ncbi:Pre-mRNA cleavage complex II protein Clp1-domain-containing protein [Dipodascopsis uninucleata]
MELPGLSTTDQANVEGSLKTVELEANNEWRFEIGLDSSVTIKVLAGKGEIFGSELVTGKQYVFRGNKLSLFTWSGCKFSWSGDVITEYLSDETVMDSYASVHFALEKLRFEAANQQEKAIKAKNMSSEHYVNEGEGPKVLIIGPKSSGKTTLAKILLSYAVRMQRSPIYVNLDPKEGIFSMPGSIAAAHFSTTSDVENDIWGTTATTGPVQGTPRYPLVYYFGSDSPLDNLRFYKSKVNRLGLAVSSRMAFDHKARISGTIIDAPGIIDQKDGYDIISNIISDFSVNVVIAVGHERLYNDMLKKYKTRTDITVLKVRRSAGVVENDSYYLRSVQQLKMKEYFHGSPSLILSSFTVTIPFSVMNVFRIVEQSHLVTSSALPIGAEETAAFSKMIAKIEVSTGLQNAILAVLNASPSEPEDDIAIASVIGFVHVVNVDEAKKLLKVMLPMPGKLPANAFLLGSYHYME